MKKYPRDGFRLVPPVARSESEHLLADEIFFARACKYVEKYAQDARYYVEKICEATTAHDLKILRSQLAPAGGDSAGGVLIYWQYESGDFEIAFFIGETL